jgi:starch synthase
MLPPVRAADAVCKCNKLGELVFATPELGRWSTVGGLGVMVDELAIGLVNLGQ